MLKEDKSMHVVIPRGRKAKRTDWIFRSCVQWKEGENILRYLENFFQKRPYLTFHHNRWFFVIDYNDEPRFRRIASLGRKKANRKQLKETLEYIFKRTFDKYGLDLKVVRIPMAGPKAKGPRRWALRATLKPLM